MKLRFPLKPAAIFTLISFVFHQTLFAEIPQTLQALNRSSEMDLPVSRPDFLSRPIWGKSQNPKEEFLRSS